MSDADFDRLTSRYPQVYRNLGRILSDRLARTNRLAVREVTGQLGYLHETGAASRARVRTRLQRRLAHARTDAPPLPRRRAPARPRRPRVDQLRRRRRPPRARPARSLARRAAHADVRRPRRRVLPALRAHPRPDPLDGAAAASHRAPDRAHVHRLERLPQGRGHAPHGVGAVRRAAPPRPRRDHPDPAAARRGRGRTARGTASRLGRPRAARSAGRHATSRSSSSASRSAPAAFAATRTSACCGRSSVPG